MGTRHINVSPTILHGGPVKLCGSVPSAKYVFGVSGYRGLRQHCVPFGYPIELYNVNFNSEQLL